MSAMASGIIGLLAAIGQIISAFVTLKTSGKIAGRFIKTFSALVSAFFIVVLGFVVRYHISLPIITTFFFALGLGIYFVSNNQFLM